MIFLPQTPFLKDTESSGVILHDFFKVEQETPVIPGLLRAFEYEENIKKNKIFPSGSLCLSYLR